MECKYDYALADGESVQSIRLTTGVRPVRLVFERENRENSYITFEDRMQPCITIGDEVTPEDAATVRGRLDEMLDIAEDIIWDNYLNPHSTDLMSEVVSFPDLRFLTGNYYVGSLSCSYTWMDSSSNYYELKEGRLRCKYHNGTAWQELWADLDSPDITRYLLVILHLRLTGDELGEEDDYMGLDLRAQLKHADDAIEFEILSHDVI